MARAIHRGRMAISATLLLGVAAVASAAELPPVQQQGTVQFISGGVDVDQARAIDEAGRHWPMTLEFAVADRPVNDYLADVDVLVRNARGHAVLETRAEGPFLLARLAPGRYEVAATFAGKTLRERLDIKAGAPARQVLLWPHDYVKCEG